MARKTKNKLTGEGVAAEILDLLVANWSHNHKIKAKIRDRCQEILGAAETPPPPPPPPPSDDAPTVQVPVEGADA